MDAITVIKASLEQSRQWLMTLLSQSKDLLTTFPTPKGGNHPLWVLGHLVCSEASMVERFVLGKDGPPGKWEPLFGMSSEPVGDAARYPSLEELLAEFDKVRGNTIRLLDSMSAADLDNKSHAPAELGAMFGTIGQCFVVIGLHVAFHAGQVADARRAAGKRPVFG